MYTAPTVEAAPFEQGKWGMDYPPIAASLRRA
ncbi:protein of unknown function (plasmid) [Cupriavidus taiwanensis]|nr:protein of unknown function [Cupriavidus taiwanensis]